MTYKFLPALLFFVELSVVYGVTTAASAHVPTVVSGPEVTMPRREVRLEVVSTYSVDQNAASEEQNQNDETRADRARERMAAIEIKRLMAEVEALQKEVARKVAAEGKAVSYKNNVPTVPFYSQFSDISSLTWQKVGCGIASLAMLIDYYGDKTESVDQLLNRGVAAGYFLDNAGWTHAGLISLSRRYGLDGDSNSLAHLGMTDAFVALEKVLKEGPVMASVHYTFEPTNPIPHLVVVNGVKDGKVYYNDPAEPSGGGTISIEKFKSAWKKRYIEIRPVS